MTHRIGLLPATLRMIDARITPKAVETLTSGRIRATDERAIGADLRLGQVLELGGRVGAAALTGGSSEVARLGFDLAKRALVPGAAIAADAGQCPGGFRIPGTNTCFEGPFQPTVPDQETVPISGRVGVTATAPGLFGALSVEPALISSIRLRCPRGLVLATDNRCYTQGKGGITNKQRKWPKAPAPVMSAQDAKTLRRAETLRDRAKRVATSAGFTCKKR